MKSRSMKSRPIRDATDAVIAMAASDAIVDEEENSLSPHVVSRLIEMANEPNPFCQHRIRYQGHRMIHWFFIT